jgi:hypothetical protein
MTKPRKMRPRKRAPKKPAVDLFDTDRAKQLAEEIMRTSLDAEMVKAGMVDLLDKFSIRDTMSYLSSNHQSLYNLTAAKLPVVATQIRKYANDLVDHCGNLEAQLQELRIVITPTPKGVNKP